MKVEIKQTRLNKALRNTQPITTTNHHQPILNSVLIKAEGKAINLSSSNTQITSHEEIAAKISEPGSIVIPANILRGLVGNLEDELITLESFENKNLKVKTKNTETVINGYPVDDYPIIPETIKNKQKILEISNNELKTIIEQVITTINKNTQNPILNGGYLYIKDDQNILVTTDTHRLSEKIIDAKIADKINIVIPYDTLEYLRNVLSGYDLDQKVAFYTNQTKADKETDKPVTQIGITIDALEIISRLNEGAFPEYKELIPIEFANEFKVAVSELQNAIKIASPFSAGEGAGIVLEFKDDTLELRSTESQIGKNVTKIQIHDCQGEGMISFNSNYLKEALSATQRAVVKFGINEKNKPCLIVGLDGNGQVDESYSHIIMPLNI